MIDSQAPLRFGTIVVVGGGCYGSYYVRQLHRARSAGKAEWTRVIVVDRNPACAMVQAQRDADVSVEIAEWSRFLAGYLGEAAAQPAGYGADAIVPSPLMPHLLFEWLHARACERWPDAGIIARAPAEFSGIPWQKEAADATRYVSYATWMCPINCIEPPKCPHTRGPRDWSLHAALPPAGHSGAVLRVTHRVYGVGMVDVADVLAADRQIRELLPVAGSFQLATASHCHGAVSELRLARAVSPGHAGDEI